MEKKILIVDDDRFYSQYLNLMLEKHFPEHIVFKASSAEEAWQMLRTNNWNHDHDFMVLDVQMPKLSGFGLMKMMNRYLEDKRQFPKVLINSSYELPEDEDMRGEGKVDFAMFQKPLHINKMKRYLEHVN